jgi:protein phosphatase
MISSKKIPLHSLVIMVGAINEDCSEYAYKNFENYEIIDVHKIHFEMCGTQERFDVSKEILEEARHRSQTKLGIGERAVIVHSNVRKWERVKFAQIGNMLGVPVFYIIVPHENSTHLKNSYRDLKQQDLFFESEESILQGDGIAEVIDTRTDTIDVVPKLPIGNCYEWIKSRGYTGVTVIPDIHGTLQSLKSAVNWARGGSRWIVFLGDIIDYGPKSLECVEYVYDLVVSGHAGLILGNHEVKIHRWLNEPPSDRRVKINAGNQITIDALNRRSASSRKEWITKFRALISLGRFHIELNNIMFSHAGSLYEWWGYNKAFLTGNDKSFALYGEMDKNTPFIEGKPNRTYGWVEDIPKGYISIVGHDIRQTVKPLSVINKNGGTVIFMDTGSGKGGKLSTADIRFSKNHTLQITNFNQF